VATEGGIEKRLKIHPPAAALDFMLDPGCVSSAGGKLIVGCGVGALELTSVQPAGGKRMSAADYLRGRKPAAFR
jgi:methionyl-tRNA formyltransferase